MEVATGFELVTAVVVGVAVNHIVQWVGTAVVDTEKVPSIAINLISIVSPHMAITIDKMFTVVNTTIVINLVDTYSSLQSLDTIAVIVFGWVVQ